ncbi:MAG: hypothetical protein ABI573_04315, partial [Chloroflexota bacterium]
WCGRAWSPRVRAREPDDNGVHPPFSLTALVQGLDPETAALAQALVARLEPNPRTLSQTDISYEIERLIIDLEERALDERSEFTQGAIAEAEQEGDRETAGRLLQQSQAINDQRLSLHRRRDQTRLLTRPVERATSTPDGSSGPAAVRTP